MDQKLIKELIKIIDESNIGEIKIVEKDFKLTITHKDFCRKAGMIAAPVAQTHVPQPIPSSPQTGAAPESVARETTKEKEEVPENLVEVRSPMIGTFYRSPSPDKEPYVKVGDHVDSGDVLCIIEAMKLFNEIESEVSGKIVKVLVENETPVEYDQPLFLIEP